MSQKHVLDKEKKLAKNLVDKKEAFLKALKELRAADKDLKRLHIKHKSDTWFKENATRVEGIFVEVDIEGTDYL